MTLQKIREDLELLRIEATNNYLGQDGKSIVVASDFKDAEQGLEAVITELDEFMEVPIKKDRYHYGYVAAMKEFREKLESEDTLNKVATGIHGHDYDDPDGSLFKYRIQNGDPDDMWDDYLDKAEIAISRIKDL